jgi:predicted metalloprotease with PDZ domain
MQSRFLKLTAVLLLSAAAVYAADEAKKCNASARECEQQIRHMLSGRRYLGISVVELKPGLVIKSIVPDGPASRADLKEGDRIVAINGRNMNEANAREFKQALADARETGTLWIIIQRRGNFRRVETRMEPYTKGQIDKIVAAHLAQSHSAIAGQP